MTFVIKKKESYFWPVKLKYPIDNGKFEEQKIDLEFKKIKNSEIKEMLKTQITDIEFCKKVITGWKDVQDENGNELVFSEFNLESILDNFDFTKQVVNEFLKSFSGAIEKN